MLRPIRRLLVHLRGRRPKECAGNPVYGRYDRLRVTEDAVEVLSKDELIDRLGWCDIEEIITFKRDLGIYDDVRLALRRGEQWLELSEEMPGWADVMEAMNRRFPGIPAGWYFEVIQPPFKTNYRVLYQRDRDLTS